jgi:hypothetical protein
MLSQPGSPAGALPATIAPTQLAVEIPDQGNPREGALRLLAMCYPQAAAELRLRIGSIDDQLDALVERARLDPLMRQADFIKQAGAAFKLQEELSARLAVIDPAAEVDAKAIVEAQVYFLVISVKRWSRGEELRGVATKIATEVRGARDAIAYEIRGLVDVYRGGGRFVRDNANVQAGFGSQADEFVHRVEGLLTKHMALTARVNRLDPKGDAGRAHGVAAAIEAAGGVDAVHAAIRPTIPVAAQVALAAVPALISRLDERLGAIDPETMRAETLRHQRQAEVERVAALKEEVAEQQATVATQLIGAAGTGERGAIASLESFAGPVLPELAFSLAMIRGDTGQLVAAIGELIGSSTPTEKPNPS